MPISWYDMVMAAFLLFALIRGAMKGIVWQLAAIAAIVLCFYFSGTLSSEIAPMIPVAAPANRWVAMFLLYVAFSFVSFGLARIVRNAMEKAKFEAFDRHLGAVFGLVKGVAFCLVVTFFVVTYSKEMHDVVMNSHTAYASAIIMDRLHPVMPEKLHDVLNPYIHSLDRPGMDLKCNHHADADDHHDHEAIAEALGDSAPIDEEFGQGSDDSFMLDDADPQEAFSSLIQEISAFGTNDPQVQETRAQKLNLALMGLPSSVSLAVVKDYYADLTGTKPDPDPQTTSRTTLDQRIVRQLTEAKVPVSRLNQSLRDRLGSSLR
jgi:membrane protein required for colicin V production